MLHGYTAVPNILIRSQHRIGLSATQFSILIQLLEYWKSACGKVFFTKKDIGNRIGLTEKTVQNNIRELEKAGFVRREQRKSDQGDWTSNIYHLDGLVEKITKLAPDFLEEKNRREEARRTLETPYRKRCKPQK